MLLLTILLFYALAPSLACSRAIDRTIAKLTDDILTESDLAEVIADVSGQYNSSFISAFDSATSESVMSMFDRALLLQEAKRLKISPPSEELHSQVESMVQEIKGNFPSEKEFYQALAAEHVSLDGLKEQLLEKVKTDYMVFHVVNSRYSVSDADVEAYKQQQQAEGDAVESFRLRRLGIPVKENGGAEAACREARALVARIITEGISFEEGIRRYSQVPGAAADGGDMGYMSTDKLSAEVRTAVQDLKVGQASAPVVAGGYANIFYMDGKRGARSALRERKFFDARKELLSDLRRKAQLQVFDDRLMKVLPETYRPILKANLSQPGERAVQSHAPAPVQATTAPSAVAPYTGPAQGYAPAPQQQYPPAPAASPTPQQRRFPRLFGNRQ